MSYYEEVDKVIECPRCEALTGLYNCIACGYDMIKDDLNYFCD